MRRDSELLSSFADYYSEFLFAKKQHPRIANLTAQIPNGICLAHKLWTISNVKVGALTYDESIRVLAIINNEKPMDAYKHWPYWWHPEDDEARQMFLDRLVERYKLKEARDERTDQLKERSADGL